MSINRRAIFKAAASALAIPFFGFKPKPKPNPRIFYATQSITFEDMDITWKGTSYSLVSRNGDVWMSNGKTYCLSQGKEVEIT